MRPLLVCGAAGQVGKSMFTFALCRLLKRSGYSVRPFKGVAVAQDLYESSRLFMSRDVLALAEACEVDPEPSINPVLIQPLDAQIECDVLTQDYRAALFVHGVPQGEYRLAEIVAMASELERTMLAAVPTGTSSALVIDGCGSATEGGPLGDVANFRLAAAVDAATLFVTDCSKGSPIGSALGALLLARRTHVWPVGLILNRSLGTSLDSWPTTRWIDMTGVPILGVLPAFDLGAQTEHAEAVRRELAVPVADNRARTSKWYDLLADSLETCINVADLIARVDAPQPVPGNELRTLIEGPY